MTKSAASAGSDVLDEFSVHEIHELSEADLLEWNALWSRTPVARPTQHSAYLRTFLEGKNSCLLVVRDATGTWRAALPVRRLSRIGIWSVLPTSRPVYTGVLCAVEDSDAVFALARFVQNRCRMLLATQVASADLASSMFFDFLAESGAGGSSFRCLNPVMSIEGPYEQHLTSIKSAKSRQTLRAKARKLERGHEVVVHEFESVAVDGGVLDRMAEIQRRSWLARRGGAILGSDFVSKPIKRLASEGLVRGWILEVDGNDAAFVLGLESGGVHDFQFTAFREDLELRDLGVILIAKVVESCCNRGLEIFDFGQGGGFDPRYYKRWWTRSCWTITRRWAGSGLIGSVLSLMLMIVFLAYRASDRLGLPSRFRRLRRLRFAQFGG